MNDETKLTPGPLQERLNEMADRKLREELNKLFDPIESMCYGKFFNPSHYKDKVIGYTAHYSNDCGLQRLAQCIREIIESSLLEQSRQRYTNDFIKKVEALQVQVEELSNQIQQ